MGLWHLAKETDRVRIVFAGAAKGKGKAAGTKRKVETKAEGAKRRSKKA